MHLSAHNFDLQFEQITNYNILSYEAQIEKPTGAFAQVRFIFNIC